MYLSDADATTFFKRVLSSMGLPTSPINIAFMLKWREGEQNPVDPSTDWNPLDTTRANEANGSPIVGATNFNSVGVKNYPDEDTGVRATAITLGLMYYTDIVEALRTEFAFANWTLISHAIRIWGTTDFADELDNGWRPSAPVETPTPTPAPQPTAPIDELNTAVLARFKALDNAVSVWITAISAANAELLVAMAAVVDPTVVPGV